MKEYTAEVWGGPHDGKIITCSYNTLKLPIPVSISLNDSLTFKTYHYVKRYDNRPCWVEETMYERLTDGTSYSCHMVLTHYSDVDHKAAYYINVRYQGHLLPMAYTYTEVFQLTARELRVYW